MSEPIDHARAWQRPVFSGVVIFGVLVCLWKLRPEDVIPALTLFIVSGLVLYLIRGVIDKGQLTEWLSIWKGRGRAS